MKPSITSRISLILALILSTSALFACGGDTPSGDTTAPGDTTPAVTDPENERLGIDDGLPAKDFGGYEFRIMHQGSASPTDAYVPEATNGDIVNDAIFERNQAIEERFNVDITVIPNGLAYQEHMQKIQQHILANDDAFDVSLNHIVAGPNYVLEGLFLNMYDLPYVDFSKPWWGDQMVDEMTVLGQLYLALDVIGMGGLTSAKVHFLNLQKFDEYKLELPYQQVLDGTWTFDKLIALTKDVYADLNGNSKSDTEDFFGYVSHASQNGFFTSFEAPVLLKDEDETLVLGVQSDKMAAIIEKMYSWYYESVGSCIVNGQDPVSGLDQVAWQAQLFADGHALVAFSKLGSASSTFRESNVEYGIIPFPKWDENQEAYRTFCGSNLLGVPVTCSDLERTSIILEAMVAENYKTVMPTYFETALKEKFSFDSETGQMLDIINDSLTISFAYAYDNWKGFGHMCSTLFGGSNPSGDFASFYATRLPSAEERLKLIVDFYEANAE